MKASTNPVRHCNGRQARCFRSTVSCVSLPTVRGINRASEHLARKSRLAVVTAPEMASVTSEHAEEVASKGKAYKDGLLVQGFHWGSHKHKPWYGVVSSIIDELKGLGATHIWLPPPSQSVSPEGYMPGQLYNLSSAYGNIDQLRDLLRELKAAGIKPVADIVINHRCADEQDEHGRWNNYRDDHDHEGHRIDWGRWAITSDDPHFGGQGNKDTGADFWGAPDLDHANPELREALRHWLEWLSSDDVGFQGWRFDYAKGYGAEFIKEYVDCSTGSEELNVGELWVDLDWQDGGLAKNQNPARQAICDWIDAHQGRACAFDFVTKGILQEAVKHNQYWRLKDKDGKAAGLIGWWPSKAVTFIDNHDTGSTQAHWPFPPKSVATGYAYILTHPGLPCVFWDHYFDWGSELRKNIDQLLQARRTCNIVQDTPMKILAAEDDLYVAQVGENLTVKLGPCYEMPPNLVPKEKEGWSLNCYGKDYAVWTKGAPKQAADSN